MANITPVDDWGNNVYQWADGDVLDGGPDSLEVLPIKQLANRSLFQRLRNVTPWSDTLAAAFGYPAGACVSHVGVTWRAKVGNGVAPGTDDAKWERWGFSADELDALLAAMGYNITAPQVFTDEQREQAQQNIALPQEWMQVLDCATISLPADTIDYQLPITGGTEDSLGDIVRVGNNIKIARAGLYAVSASINLLTASAGIPACRFKGYVNGVEVSLLSSGVQDKTSAPGVGQGYRTAWSGVVRLEVDDLVGFWAHQNIGAVISLNANLNGASVTRLAV